MKGLFSAAALAMALVSAAPAAAAPVIVDTDANLRTAPFTFAIQGVNFTFGATGDIFAPVSVSNGPGGAISSVFGAPSSFFTNRGTVSFGPNVFGAFTSFSNPTSVRFSIGENFFGLRATVGADTFFGFAFTTNSTLNGYGFETTPGAAITATTAVPEPGTWAMLIVGFAAAGAGMRYRRRTATTAHA